jgi:hypothetical protein
MHSVESVATGVQPITVSSNRQRQRRCLVMCDNAEDRAACTWPDGIVEMANATPTADHLWHRYVAGDLSHFKALEYLVFKFFGVED